jgi:hypothetical protein
VVPVAHEHGQIVSQRVQFFDAPIERLQSLAQQRTDSAARRAAAIPLGEHATEILERKSHAQRTLYDEYALDVV